MKNSLKKYKEIITYIIFGVLTTLVNWIIYYFCKNYLITSSGSFAVGVCNAIAWVGGVAFAYVTNKLWVFESKSWKPNLVFKEIVTFVAARAVTGLMEIFGVPALSAFGFDRPFMKIANSIDFIVNSKSLSNICNTDAIFSKVFVAVFVVILNYFFSKFITFKKKKTQEVPTAEVNSDTDLTEENR